MNNIKNWFSENFRFIILVILAVLFFFVYSYLPYQTPLKFNSPDETANFYFIRLLTEQDHLKYHDALNLVAGNIIHPRSIAAVGGNLVPGSFLGLILIYGFVAKFIGPALTIYLTPLVSILAVLFFYKIIQRLFNKNIAFFSSLLLLILPGWWYYTSRSLIPNVLFVSLLIIGLFFLTRLDHASGWINFLYSVLGSLFISLALTVRTSEVIWVLLFLFILWLFYIRDVGWYHILVFLTILIIVFIPILYYNQILYGSIFSTGYTDSNSSSILLPQQSSFIDFLFPFGVNLKTALRNFYNYYIWLFWWFFIPAILGSIVFILKIFRRPKKQKAFFLSCLLVSLYLVIYYGSWIFYDNINTDQITIGNSYVRYFLPIYIFSLPYAGLLFSKFLKKKRLGGIVLTIIILAMAFFSVKLTVYGPQEGILKVKENILKYENISKEVFEMTEENSVIIANRSDKLFFPERRVIFELVDDKHLEGVSKILDQEVPVYVFNLTYPKKDIDFLNNRFAAFGYFVSEPIKNFDNLSLYRLDKK